ncbi:MAG: 4'-phosphopantetheinyl transferase superfamily protein [Verrucomicrobia bacterium]|nr:4'-phosphopantetheinyl transferase superfamily protein [Verrucomicrobiota bacterium]MBS0636913.1 4'-phosphopantetheinyl transferase superfamily protein [Verrucomicrobiota bacterium]
MRKPLSNTDIDLWKIDLVAHGSKEEALFSLLNEDEKIRAQRFITPLLKSRYTIAQGMLRVLLAHYISIKPEAIEYSFGPYKKPYLKYNPENLQFNLTHSNDMALIAISQSDEVGVDIERINTKTLEKGLEQSIFSEDEYSQFYKTSPEKRPEAFFAAWTHKESILKLIGTGLYKELKTLEVPLTLAEEPTQIQFEKNSCYIQSFYVTPEYIGAVASPKAAKVKLKSLEDLHLSEVWP